MWREIYYWQEEEKEEEEEDPEHLNVLLEIRSDVRGTYIIGKKKEEEKKTGRNLAEVTTMVVDWRRIISNRVGPRRL
jgi:hypothetical protein